MSTFGGGIGLVAGIGGVLLVAALIYAYVRNRASSPRDLAQTETATRDLYHAEADAQHHRDEADQPPR